MDVTVTLIRPFFKGGKKLLVGEKIKVTSEEANELAYQGLIKSVLMPVIDKMIKKPKGRKNI